MVVSFNKVKSNQNIKNSFCGVSNQISFCGASLPQDTFEQQTEGTSKKKNFLGCVKSVIEKAVLKVGTVTKHTSMPVAGELLKLSLMSDEQRISAVTPEMGKVLNPEQSKELLASLNMFEGDSKHTTTEQMKLQTVVFSKDSKIAKTVNDNKFLKEKIKSWINNGEKSDEHVAFNTADSGSFDLRMGLGFSKIVGLHRTSDNCIEGYVEDVYDFDKIYCKGKHEEDNLLKKIKSKSVQIINNMAYDLQQDSKLRPYRCLIPVKVEV